MVSVDKAKLLYFMNVRKLTPSHLAGVLGEINLEASQKEPLDISDSKAIEICKVLRVTPEDIKRLPKSPRYIFQSAEALAETKRKIYRDNIHFYNYYTLPTPEGYISPVILDILCPHDRLPQLNNGHFEEAITVNLGPGDIMGRWAKDVGSDGAYDTIRSNKESDCWITGDSYFEPCYCPHSYSLAEGAKPARIVSYTAYNEASKYKEFWQQRDKAQLELELSGRQWSHCYNVIERYRKCGFISKNSLCESARISLDDYERLKRERLDESVMKRLAKTINIDYRLLAEGGSGGDSLGKEYMSLEESKKAIRLFEGYEVAPTARSERSPDLKGTFIKVNSENGGKISLQHNIHYLVIQGDIKCLIDVGGGEEEEQLVLKTNDSLWFGPSCIHAFGGKGSLLALTNGEKYGYLTEFALSNLWQTRETLGRMCGKELGWGYDH